VHRFTFIPALWRMDNKYAQAEEHGVREKMGFPSLKRLPSEYFRTNIHVTTSGVEDSAVLELCVKKLGRDRILFAVDYPYEDTARAVKWFRGTNLDAETKTLIGSGNSRRVFGLV